MRTLAMLALAVTAAAAQDLPPGVLQLSRIKRHIRQEVEHLPDYSCLETVQRSGQKPGTRDTPQRLQTVRVEVLFTGDRELYSPMGEAAFTEHPISEYSSEGVIGDGIFGTDVHNLFVADAASFVYRGEEQVRGILAEKYDFRIPALISRFHVAAFGSTGNVGMQGTFWADPKAYELLRIESHAAEIPPTLAVSDLTTVVDFARMRIGESDVTLAQTALVNLLGTSGEEADARFDFTHCRAFRAESTVSFGTRPDETVGAALRPGFPLAGPVRETLPAGIVIPVTLTTPLTAANSVGDLIEARVAASVIRKGKPEVPEGTVLRGRLRRLEREPGAGRFNVELEFTEIEMPAGPARFFADLQEPVPVENDQRWIRDVPGVASISVRGSDFQLPRGFRLVWRTRGFEEADKGRGAQERPRR